MKNTGDRAVPVAKGKAVAIGYLAVFLWGLSLVGTALDAQPDYGYRLGKVEGGEVVYYATGTGLQMDAIYPSLMKWYLPEEVAGEYRRQWHYTNYAEEKYRRYLGPDLEGQYFYDMYGRRLDRGWLVYDWRQTQPVGSQGSGILQTGQYSGWFNSLVVSADTRGQHHFNVAIGDEIFATLTPMTFRKTAYNGILFEYAGDRYAATGLMSRINLPGIQTAGQGAIGPSYEDNFTNLLGLRAVWNLGDFVQLGGTFLNAHNGRTATDRFEGSPFEGKLTTGQLDGRIDRIVIRLSDDSPEDGEGGATLFSSDIEITTRIGERDTVLTGSRIGFRPRIKGGVERDGFLVAEGRGETSQILLEYIFSAEDPAVFDLETVIPEADLVNNISKVRFRLVLSNDYKVEVTSNRQTDNQGAFEQSQFTTVTRARGNVKDNSNQQVVEFDYGLPTATQVFGFTFEVDEFAGFKVYGELNINHQFRQYPIRTRDTYSSSSGIRGRRAAKGWMLNFSRDFQPFFLSGEFFGMDPEYDTSPRFVDSAGRVNYADTEEAAAQYVYDFVDDNDDHDRKNDQKRRYDDGRVGEERTIGRTPDGFADEAVFPGLDENNDFISDFNQNSLPVRPNYLPDYEEPFLRYGVDRPEFLFAIDLNNNGWGDRFENDDEPDYPYKRDRLGYNVSLGTWIVPEMRFTVGQARVRRLSTGEKNLTTYGLLAYERNLPVWGKITFYDMVKRAEDHIADDLVQWVQLRPMLGRPSSSPGSMVAVPDPLAMPNTLVNKLWLGFERSTNFGFNTESKFIFESIRQRDDDLRDRSDRALEENTRRLGVINKFEYLKNIGRVLLLPRFKHEFFADDTPYNIERLLGNPAAEREEWTGIFSLQAKVPFMKQSTLQFGLERLIFRNFNQEEVSVEKKVSGLNIGDATGDYHETSIALQLSNITSYQGYRLMSQIGLRVDKRRIERFREKDESETSGLTFITVIAGLGG